MNVNITELTEFIRENFTGIEKIEYVKGEHGTIFVDVYWKSNDKNALTLPEVRKLLKQYYDKGIKH